MFTRTLSISNVTLDTQFMDKEIYNVRLIKHGVIHLLVTVSESTTTPKNLLLYILCGMLYI